MKAKVWQARLLAGSASLVIFLAGVTARSSWAWVITVPAAILALQFALSSAYWIGQSHVHQGRVEELERSQIEKFLNQMRDDGDL